MYDVIIVGGGVIGSMIFRELTKYNLKIMLIEKERDLACGATKANSAIIHGGYDASHNKLKGKLSYKGNQMYDKLEEQLNFGFKRIGSLVLGFSSEDRKKLEVLLDNGRKNGVPNLRIIDKEEISKLEGNISKEAVNALYCPHTGICSPYELTIALGENAIRNGGELKLNEEVVGIETKNKSYEVKSNKGTYEGKIVINASGVYADKIANMVGIEEFEIVPRAGEYLLFERGYGAKVNHVLFQVPSQKGKGVLIAPTIFNNLIIGPNAQEVEDKDSTDTHMEDLLEIWSKAKKTIDSLEPQKVLKSYAGLRASGLDRDFYIKDKDGFINVACIDSPGLTSAPAIAEMVVEMVGANMELEVNKEFYPDRNEIRNPNRALLDMKEREEFINLPWGANERIVCRCEQVREADILEAKNRGIGLTSFDAYKKRTRLGMGFCQGRFCEARLKEYIDEGVDFEGRREGSGLVNRISKVEFLKKLKELDESSNNE